MEHSGYYIWEGTIFLVQILVGMGLLVLRRKASGRPAFTDNDRQLFLSRARVSISTTRFWLNFSAAAFLCFFAGLLVQLIVGPFGPGVLATAQLITFMGIVKKSLC